MSALPPLQDAEARTQAIDPLRSILLQAPAGSGKTSVLTQRLLALLAVVDEPEEILAITFTRKAAGEMRERVLVALRGEVDPAAPTTRQLLALREQVLANQARRGWDVVSLPLRLRIQTIDAFNHWLASRLPVLGRNAPRLQPVDDARTLYARAARQALLDAGSDPQLEAAAGQVFARLDNDWARTEALLAQMLAQRSHWLRHLHGDPQALGEQLAQSLRNITRATLQRASQCLRAHLPEGMAIMAAAAQYLRLRRAERAEALPVWVQPLALEDDPAHLPHWVELANLALKRDGDWRGRLDVQVGFPTHDPQLKERGRTWIAALARVPAADRCLADLRALPPPVSAEDREALAALAVVLRLAASELRLLFQETGRVDHAEVAGAARQALGDEDEPTDLAMRLGTRLRHLLVDEFQDVSLEQFGLLERLTAGWEPGDGRSVFLVGDPMQSIYQFREAEVGLFLRARARGLGPVPLQFLSLSRNFRSDPALVSWFNDTFARVFPDADDQRSAAVSYLPSTTAYSEAAHAPAGVAVICLPDAAAQTEAREVLRIVQHVRERRPAARIAVLLSTRNQAPALTAALRAGGVAINGTELEPLAARAAVRDVGALARALLHDEDRPAWLAVLRAPWCGLSLVELVQLTGEMGEAASPSALSRATIWQSMNDAQRVGQLPATARQRLARCRQVLAAARARRDRGDLVRLLELTWIRLGGPATCGEPRDLRDVRTFLDSLGSLLEEGEAPSAGALELLAGRLFGSSGTDDPAAVEMLTIHASKGLEWDVVILPGLQRTPRQDTPGLLRWLELPRENGGSDLVMAALAIGQKVSDDALANYIDKLKGRRRAHERVRLAYVAATRARSELWLLGHAAPNARGTIGAPDGSLLRILWPAVEATFVAAAPLPVTTGGTDLAGVESVAEQRDARLPEYLLRLGADWAPPVSPPDVPAESLAPSAETLADTVPEYSWVGFTARAIGTLVHAEIEDLAAGAALPDEAALAARAARQERGLLQLGVPAAERSAALLRVQDALRRTLRDRRGRWLLGAHPGAQSELRLTGVVGQRLVSAVIDRSFVDEDGTRWVVDFKTSFHEGAGLEEFLQSELQRYRPQLLQYVELAGRLGSEPVRAALYFPLLGELRELPPAQ